MKKLMCLLLSLLLMCTLVACGGAPVVISVDENTQDAQVTVDEEAAASTDADNTTAKTGKTENTQEKEPDDGEQQEETESTTTAYVKKTRGTTVRKTRPSREEETFGTTKAPVKDLYDPVTLKQEGLLATDGRVLEGYNGLSWMYSDSGITITGTLQGEVSVDVLVGVYDCWFNVVVDGNVNDVKTVRLSRGHRTLVACTNLKKGTHTIQISSGTKYTGDLTTIERIHYDGTLKAPAKKALQLEFIGDSVTCSEGSIKEGGYSIDGHNSFYGYAAMTARALNAGISVEAICGQRTAGMYSKFLDSYWDFASNPKDIVVINLGTNDVGWPGFSPSSTFKSEVKNLISAVRSKYGKNTYIVWAYGMMFDNNLSVVKAAVEEYASSNNDVRVLFCDMSSVKNTEGYGMHPSQEGHAKAATFLTAYLKKNCK